MTFKVKKRNAIQIVGTIAGASPIDHSSFFFETAGHTFLYEITHLDQLGCQSFFFSEPSCFISDFTFSVEVAALSERETLEPGISSHGSNDNCAVAGG